MDARNHGTEYVRQSRSLGVSDDAIEGALRSAGWSDADIEASLSDSPAHNSPAIIEVSGLTKRYARNTLTAVDGISFSVNRGEVFGILGPNGAGKTTTLEMIEGLKTITAGSVTVDGLDVATQSQEVKNIIGVQLQASSFFEELTLKELLELFGSLYHRRVDAMALLADVGLAEKASSFVKELSGGQKQRFSIAAGLVNLPKVLFLDEPTTGLDPQARRNLWELVRDIKARGTTIVLTTHYMEEAEVLCDRIAVMDNARIVALDTVEGLKRAANAVTMEEVFLTLTGHELRD
jgi:ABC-2 type transport system ATP-binding protein